MQDRLSGHTVEIKHLLVHQGFVPDCMYMMPACKTASEFTYAMEVHHLVRATEACESLWQ